MILLNDLFKKDEKIGFDVDKEDSLEFLNYLYFNDFFVLQGLTYKKIMSIKNTLHNYPLILHRDGTIHRAGNQISVMHYNLIRHYKYSDIKKGIINNLGEKHEKH